MGDQSAEFRVLRTTDELGKAVAAHVLAVADEVLEAGGVFLVALSGGSLPKMLGPALADLIRAAGRDDGFLRAWRFCYADERIVPLDHADSNHAACRGALFDEIGVADDQILTIDPALDPEACAAAYGAALGALGKEAPDLVLLGMGPDGHTASLFPGHPLAAAAPEGGAGPVLAIVDSPKPPPRRVTLSLPALCRSRHVAFVVAGDSKRAALHRVRGVLEGREGADRGDSVLPAARVRPRESLVWFVDAAAAATSGL